MPLRQRSRASWCSGERRTPVAEREGAGGPEGILLIRGTDYREKSIEGGGGGRDAEKSRAVEAQFSE